MILEKTTKPLLRDVSGEGEKDGGKEDFLRTFVQIHHIYRSAMQEASTRLDILDREFASIYDHSPIHHMECRVKALDSLVEKMKRKGLEVKIDNVYKIQDIAGIRVICNYVDDIYYLRGLLVGSNGFQLIRESDYIKSPKPNGYRSLHLIVSVPFVISEGRMELPVEIQLRTIAMDMWASLEHELRYKSTHQFSEEDQRELARCSEVLADVDQTMQSLFQKARREQSRKKEEEPEEKPTE